MLEYVVYLNMIEKNETDSFAKYDNNTIISVGRLEPVKDFSMLLDVFYRVHEVNKDLKLKIVGEGSQREILEKKIRELKLEDFVTINWKNIFRKSKRRVNFIVSICVNIFM